VTGDSGRAVRLEQACSYLRGADPVPARLIDARPDFDPRAWLARLPPMDLFGALLYQVIGQQLSIAAPRRCAFCELPQGRAGPPGLLNDGEMPGVAEQQRGHARARCNHPLRRAHGRRA
jgi:hypothetical protein